MRVMSERNFLENGLITLKDSNWLNKQRIAGKCVASTLMLLESMIKYKFEGTLLEYNNEAEKHIASFGCTPTFKNYKGFPSGVCISVNKELVHGIPSDKKLQDGDVISFDLGATYEGAIADSAITVIFGTPKSNKHVELIKATNESLLAGINAIAVDKRLGVIGNAISKKAKEYGFGLVTRYGGHGLEWDKPHAPPFVSNKASVDEGIRIQPGLAIAIEPMLTIGVPETKTLNDGWTVVTNDIGAHFEHSIYVHEDRVEIITDRNYE